MSDANVAKQNVLPAAIKAIFARLIDGKEKQRNDWKAVASELILPAFKAKPQVHTVEVPTYDRNLKGIRADQYAVMYCAKHVPKEPVGSEAYKDARNAGQRDFNSDVNRALLSLGYMVRKPRAPRSSGSSADTNDVAELAKQKSADLAQLLVQARRELKDSQSKQGEKFSAEVMSYANDLSDRLGKVSEALVAFQTKHTLESSATKAIGKIADGVRMAGETCKKLSDALISGTSPKQAATALAAAMKKAVIAKVVTGKVNEHKDNDNDNGDPALTTDEKQIIAGMVNEPFEQAA